MKKEITSGFSLLLIVSLLLSIIFLCLRESRRPEPKIDRTLRILEDPPEEVEIRIFNQTKNKKNGKLQTRIR